MWLSFGLVFITVALLFSGSYMLLTLPQWTLVIPVGLLGLWGCSKQSLQKANHQTNFRNVEGKK
ncbi:hypothetical protein B9G39_15790 [Zooshikella ganghwensis]|uniref:Uncharacterized protein n=1 Tax=Zooshikella ganghwensis TaxID=202772 RepID=A0A4P9VPC0_9GAMM|nr:hypothetical protein B9G39_15790 [Zooshikella ganghwensis]